MQQLKAIHNYPKKRLYIAVDLFCGAGGLSYGLQLAGIKTAAGVDNDASCKYPFETNIGADFECKDVKELTSTQVLNWFNGADISILAGCAPCQPFSTYSNSRKSIDDRWSLLWEFYRIVDETRPDIVSMENVPGLSKQPIWEEFVRELKKIGYHIDWQIVNCSQIGLPQNRRRLVMLASKLGCISFSFQPVSKKTTVRDAIAHLPKIEAGESCNNDRLHRSARLSPKNLERIKYSKSNGTWRDWPIELRADCHKKQSGISYPSVYGRMSWDNVSPTITTQAYGFGNGRFGHPEQNRAISLREAAILQSFPDTYSFLNNNSEYSIGKIGTLIGNAVPPLLGKAIGEVILNHIEKHIEQ